MNQHLPPENLADDVAWVRRHLGPADPVRSSGPAPVTEPPAVLAAAPAPHHPRARVAVAALTAAALVGAAVAVVATHGGGSGHATRVASGAPIFAAAATTEAAHTAQVSVSVTVGSEVVDVQGEVDLTAHNADFTATLPMSIGTVEVRTIGTVAYVRLPANLQGVVGGKAWIQADLPTVDGLAGQQLGLPGLGAGLDVTALLDWLRGVSGTVTDIGSETIHGITATHYRADVDLTKAAADAPAAVRPGVEQAAQAVGQTVPVDVWVDAQGRLVQLTTSVDPGKFQAPAGTDLPGTDVPGAGPVAVTVDLWNFGMPVDVTAPPADQVSALPIGGALRSVLGGGGLGGLHALAGSGDLGGSTASVAP